MTRLAGLRVPTVVLSRGSSCPASPSLQWVPGVTVPHLHRYYAPLRLPLPIPVGTLVAPSPVPCVRNVIRVLRPQQTEAKLTGPPSAPGRCPGLLMCQYPRSSGAVRTETVGSPEFPSRPFERMPCSQTPVVTGDLANDNRPPVCCLPVDEDRRLSALRCSHRTYPIDHDYTHFGAQSRGLRPRLSLCFAHPVSGIALRVGCRPAG